jgi:hypothetical protein
MALRRLIPPLQLSQEGRESLKRSFTPLTQKQIRCGMKRSARELHEIAHRHTESTNHLPKPFVCTKTTDEILASFALFCKRIYDSGR